MFRRLAGSSFALVLVALVAMKHVALGFCLCQEQVVTEPATCCTTPVPASACCPCGEEAPAEAPCRDCVVDLKLDPGAFLWDADEFSPDEQVADPVVVATSDLVTIPDRDLPASVPTRGSPPGLPPLWLRHSVLRL